MFLDDRHLVTSLTANSTDHLARPTYRTEQPPTTVPSVSGHTPTGNTYINDVSSKRTSLYHPHNNNLHRATHAATVAATSAAHLTLSSKSSRSDLLTPSSSRSLQQQQQHQHSHYRHQQQHTQHTTEPVPLVYVGPRAVTLRQHGGTLADVAPTILALLDLAQPDEMSGQSLFCTSP